MTARASPSSGPIHHRTMSAGISSPLFPASTFEQAAAALGGAAPQAAHPKVFPMSGASALGGTLRLEAPIVAQTVRCYQVFKVDTTSLHHATTGGGATSTSIAPAAGKGPQPSTSPAQSPIAASSPRFPQDGPQISASDLLAGSASIAGSDASRGRSFVDSLWRIATLTDLLLLAICVLINVPTVAKLLTSAATLSADGSTASALVSFPTTNAAAGGTTGDVYEQHDLLSMERMAALLSAVVSVTPYRTISALDTVGVWLRTNINIRLICVLFGVDEYVAWRRLADIWRGSLAPVLSSPPIFWTIALVTLVCLRICLRARHVFMQRVVVVSGVGMQLTTFNYMGSVVQQRFLDVNRIHSVVIHEAFLRQRIVFYLAVIVDNEADVTVLFEEMVPRLTLLRPLLCGIRSVLFEEPEEGATLGELEEQAANANASSGMLPS